MYTCCLHIYFVGHPSHTLEVIRRMPPLEHFTHIFSESDDPEASLTAEADVILADLTDNQLSHTLPILLQNRRPETQLLLLVSKKQLQSLCADSALSNITDIWVTPMSDEELRFRFLRWQETCKMNRDFRETSHFLEATINNIPNLIWYKDKNGVHEKVNDSFCKAVNKTKQQVEGQRHAYIWDVAEDDPVCIESEHQVMSKRQTLVSEENILAGDEKRTLMCYKSPLYNFDNTVMGTVGVAIDVTKERAYEQEIMKKNQTLETIFATIDCGIMNHSLEDSRILNINRAALQILGYETLDEMLADGFDLIAASVVEEDQERLRSSIRSLKKVGDTVNVEYRVRHKNGDVIHVMGNIKLYEENGELFCQRFLLDFTEQKLQEKKNEKWRMELVHALSLDFTLVCFVDSETGLTTPIRAEGQNINLLFDGQLSLEESMESYICQLVHEDDRDMMRAAISLEALKRELKHQKVFITNYRRIKDDETVYFQMKAVSAGTESGEHGIVLGFRSVDAEIRKEMEQNALLEAALSQANQASKAKSVFLSNMSHDIRTPMNAIVGFTDLAITHIDQQELVDGYLRKIKTSGNHLLSLINDILDMSRIESGKIHLEEAPCSLPEILNGLRNILQADVNAKQLELQIDTVDVVDEEICCDKLRLNQVLLNLLGNAVKYTGTGGSINMRIIEKAGASAGYANYVFIIRDNGIGMSPEFVARIFEPFERERNSTISKIQGTGLGMAITKNIVDMMNGTIEVKSEPGVGSEFTVSFTFRLHTGKEKLPVIEEIPRLHHTGRILLAEDVEMNQEIAVAILENAGFSVDVADNGQIAVDMLQKSEPGYYQAVLMDVQMPVMNGYEATRKIRALENKELASLPIIAMTANAFAEDREAALKSGMNGHISKPIDVQVLFKTLDSII